VQTIPYTTIAKLILRASNKVNGGHTIASARRSLAMRGGEPTTLLERPSATKVTITAARFGVTLSIHPNSIFKFSWGT
jgi:hypothetical protein